MKMMAGAVAAAVAILGASGAQAATMIDFDELKHGSVVKVYSAPIVSQDFSFTSDVSQNGIGVWGATGNNADLDGGALVNWSSRAITVRRTDGDFFSLSSLDLADTYNVGTPSALLFTFFDGLKTSTKAVTLDKAKGLQTFAFEQDRLQWFSVAQVNGSLSGMQIDNVLVGAASTAAVPEPAAWAMMILGFGSAGSVLRRSRNQAMAG